MSSIMDYIKNEFYNLKIQKNLKKSTNTEA